MATAQRMDADYSLVLTLSRNEAETLRVVLGLVGGDRLKSPRRHAQSILDALRGVGVEPIKHKLSPHRQNDIYFDDDEQHAA